MKPIRKILEFFRVKKTIRYHGTLENLERILEIMEHKRLNNENFFIEKIGKYQYSLNPPISLGTMSISANSMTVHSNQITVNVNLNSKNDNLQEIEFIGSIHWSHLFIFFTFLFMLSIFVALLIKDGEYGGLIVIGIIWPISHLWFNFVWTSQEKALIEEVKLALHIRIRSAIV